MSQYLITVESLSGRIYTHTFEAEDAREAVEMAKDFEIDPYGGGEASRCILDVCIRDGNTWKLDEEVSKLARAVSAWTDKTWRKAQDWELVCVRDSRRESTNPAGWGA